MGFFTRVCQRLSARGPLPSRSSWTEIFGQTRGKQLIPIIASSKFEQTSSQPYQPLITAGLFYLEYLMYQPRKYRKHECADECRQKSGNCKARHDGRHRPEEEC